MTSLAFGRFRRWLLAAYRRLMRPQAGRPARRDSALPPAYAARPMYRLA